MKLSVSLPEDDLAFLDEYAARTHLPSRSAAVQKAVRALRVAELSAEYAAAWEEFDPMEEAALWETTVGDGLDDE